MSDWPDALRVNPEIEAAARSALETTCERMRLSAEETAALVPPVLGLASWLVQVLPKPAVVGLAGSQGSGKSTIAELLEVTLTEAQSLRVARLSIDDFYLTRAERVALGRDVHPLLQTRGVAGTHDMTLMGEVIDGLRHGDTVSTPRFDKAVDDRQPDFEHIQGPVDVVIVEGWCVGARPESEATLADPINVLESGEDPDGAWRAHVNARLQDDDYRRVFDGFDRFIFLQVPGMDAVFNWRLRQEDMLRATAGDKSGVMDADGVRRFIMHYERTTRNMLAELPDVADVVLRLNDSHEIESAGVLGTGA